MKTDEDTAASAEVPECRAQHWAMLSAFVRQEAWHLGSRDQRQQILSATTSL